MSSHRSTSPRQTSPGPGVPLKTPNIHSDVLDVRREREVGGLFGIGLKVDTEPPHLVQNISTLLDPDNTNVSSLVKIGDGLWAVDGVPTEQEPMDVVEALILGTKDSPVRLTLKDKDTGRKEELLVKRHVAIRTWDEPLTSLELRTDLLGQPLIAEAGIVEALEGIRDVVMDRAGYAMDLLKGDGERVTGLGLHLALEMSDSKMRPRQIQVIVPGSPADRCRGLRVGDEVVAVEGIEAKGDAATDKELRGTDVIGSNCTLRVQRGAALFDVTLQRTSASNIRSTGRLVGELDAVCMLLEEDADPSFIRRSLASIHSQVIEVESRRCKAEAELAARLYAMQGAVAEGVSEAEALLHPQEHRATATALQVEVAGLEADLEEARADLEGSRRDLARVGRQAEALAEALEEAVEGSERAVRGLGVRVRGLPSQRRFDAAVAAVQGLQAENAGLREQMAGMVGREQLLAAQAEGERLQEALSRARRAHAAMAPREELDAALERVAWQQAQLERKERALEGMVPRSEVAAAEERREMLEADNARLQALLARRVPQREVEAAEEEARAALLAKERLSKALLEMVPQTDLKIALQDAKLAWDQVATLKERLASAEGQAEDLALRQENLVPRTELVAAKADSRLLQEKAAALEQDVEALEQSGTVFREQARALLQEKDALRQHMEGLVDPQLLAQARHESKHYQDEAEACRMELEAANALVNQILEQLAAVKEEVSNQGLQLDGMVPRKKLLQARAELQSTSGELEGARREQESQSAQAEALGERNRALRVEVERLRVELAETAPQAALAAARAEGQGWRGKAEALEGEVAEQQAQGARLRGEVARWKEEAERVQRSAGDKVERGVLQAARAEGAAARAEAEELREEVQGLRAAQEESRADRSALRAQVAELQREAEDLVPRVELLAAQARARAAEEAVEKAVTAKSHLETSNLALRAQVNQLKEEMLETQANAAGQVTRREHETLTASMEAAVARSDNLAAEKAAVSEQLHAAQSQVRDALGRRGAGSAGDEGGGQVRSLRAAVEEWEERGAGLVERREAEAAARAAAADRERADAAERRVRGVEGELQGLRERQRLLKAEVEAMAPRSELAAAREEAREAREEAAAAGKEKGRAEAALAEAEGRAGEEAEVREQLRAVQGEAQAARQQLEELQAAAPPQKLAAATAERDRLAEELAGLREGLQQAGMADAEAVEWVGSMLGGPHRDAPSQLSSLAEAARRCEGGVAAAGALLEGVAHYATSPPALARLLKTMQGPPRRAPSEMERVVLLLNQTPPLAASDLEALRKVLVGPPAHSPQSLAELLEEVATAGAARELREEAEAERRRRSDEAAGHRIEVSKLERERCGAPGEHAEVRRLRAELAAVRGQLTPEPPSIEPPGSAFEGKVVVAVGSENTRDLIFCTLDDSTPGPSNFAGKGFAPHTLTLTYSCTLKAVAQNQAGHLSGVATAEFHARPSPLPAPAPRAVRSPALADKAENVGRGRAGVGLELEQEGGRMGAIVVRGVTPGGAAEREGTARVGDRVVAVDGARVAGLGVEEVEGLVAGPEGSSVGLSLQRSLRTRAGGALSLLAAVLRRSPLPPSPAAPSASPDDPPSAHSSRSAASASRSPALYGSTLARQRAGSPPPDFDEASVGVPDLSAPLPHASSPPEEPPDALEYWRGADRERDRHQLFDS